MTQRDINDVFTQGDKVFFTEAISRIIDKIAARQKYSELDHDREYVLNVLVNSARNRKGGTFAQFWEMRRQIDIADQYLRNMCDLAGPLYLQSLADQSLVLLGITRSGRLSMTGARRKKYNLSLYCRAGSSFYRRAALSIHRPKELESIESQMLSLSEHFTFWVDTIGKIPGNELERRGLLPLIN